MSDDNDTVQLSRQDASILAQGMKLLQQMNSNAEAKPLLERALKAVNPSVRTTEEQLSEVAAPMLTEVKAIRDELASERQRIADERKAAEEAAAERQMADSFAMLRAKDGLTDDGEAAVKQLMVDRKIADPAAAFALFQKLNPTPVTSVASYSPQTWEFESKAVDQDVEGLFKNPDAWADRQIGQILTEMRTESAV